MSDADERERRSTRNEFHTVVNMTPSALRRWLGSEQSRSVGMTAEGDKVTAPGDGEAVGHRMGERILQQAMRRVIGYVHRHLAQRPKGDVTDSRWRYSLMNWGHDPLED